MYVMMLEEANKSLPILVRVVLCAFALLVRVLVLQSSLSQSGTDPRQHDLPSPETNWFFLQQTLSGNIPELARHCYMVQSMDIPLSGQCDHRRVLEGLILHIIDKFFCDVCMLVPSTLTAPYVTPLAHIFWHVSLTMLEFYILCITVGKTSPHMGYLYLLLPTMFTQSYTSLLAHIAVLFTLHNLNQHCGVVEYIVMLCTITFIFWRDSVYILPALIVIHMQNSSRRDDENQSSNGIIDIQKNRSSSGIVRQLKIVLLLSTFIIFLTHMNSSLPGVYSRLVDTIFPFELFRTFSGYTYTPSYGIFWYFKALLLEDFAEYFFYLYISFLPLLASFLILMILGQHANIGLLVS